MTDKSKYLATLDIDCIRFLGVRNGAEYGYVEVLQKPYRVYLPDGEPVGIVNALCDALPLILDHIETEHLERRRREFARDNEAARLSLLPLATSG